MSNQEKQTGYAQALFARGLITESEMIKVINAKFSYEIVETLIDIASGIVDPCAGRSILVRMCKYA